jgi:polyisoprenoid-binding protein YceI
MRSTFLLAGFLLAAAVPLAAADHAVVFDLARSTVEVAVKATVDSFTGRLSGYTLSAAADEGGRITAARLDFRFRDVLTGKPKRDEAMHAWQDTANHPDASFVLAALTPDADGTQRATGRLTLHGVTRELSFPVRVTQAGAELAVDGDAAVDTRDFGLPVIRLMGLLKVDPVVHVRFHLQGRSA